MSHLDRPFSKQPTAGMEREVWFQLVGEDGSPLVAIDYVMCVERVADVRKAVSSANKRSHLKDIDHGNLVVFASTEAFNARHPLARASSLITNLGLDEDHPIIVQRPVIAPSVPWSVASEPCLQLVVGDDDRLIRLPASCVNGTGLGRSDRGSDQPVILYRRPELVRQWNEMNRCSIRAYALLWIVGAPGTGKSCAALAFACSIDRSEWDVLWIHYSINGGAFNCVGIQGSRKSVCVVRESAINPVLNGILSSTLNSQRRTIVFLDGYNESAAATNTALELCRAWHNEDKYKHRLVCVSSMSGIRKKFKIATLDLIPTDASSPDDVEMSTGVSTNADDTTDAVESVYVTQDEMTSQMLFSLTSWLPKEYEEAVLNDEFFETVRDKFPPYKAGQDGNEEKRSRLKLLEEKYSVAGGSARFMFDVTTSIAIRSLKQAMSEVLDVDVYLTGLIGDSGAGVVNTLLARYEGSSSDEIRLVSDYVVRAIAVKAGPQLLKKLKELCCVNPSVDGFLLEAWFFAQLSKVGLQWSMYVGTELQFSEWKMANVYFFDSDKYPISISLVQPIWLAPCKWNQGGYDAVFINKKEELVRFIQVTRATTHSLDYTHFTDFLNKLVARTMQKIALVEVYFVVPMSRLAEFRLPVSDQDFLEAINQVVETCAIANIMAIGVDYEMSNNSFG